MNDMSDVDKIVEILSEVDPEGFLRLGIPADEYKQEARILLERVVDRPLTPEYIRDVWLVMFATGERVAYPAVRGRHGLTSVTWIGDVPMRDHVQDDLRPREYCLSAAGIVHRLQLWS